MANYNLKTLDGVFLYSIVSGILLAVFLHTGLDVSETGIAMLVLTTIENTLGSPNPYLVPTISIAVTIGEILMIIHQVRQIADHGPAGMLVSVTGFLGSLATFLGSVSGLQAIMYVGIVLWIIGALAARFSE